MKLTCKESYHLASDPLAGKLFRDSTVLTFSFLVLICLL